ncbi:hypothetical protein ABUL04_26365 [Micromonospora harpali]|uniref:Uncharacterized protein n=1 Tax=Micromonospora harpali TaxID=1490225 RepID=A0ABW1HHA9_9ACTN
MPERIPNDQQATLRMRGDVPTLTLADGVQQQLKLLVSRRLDLGLRVRDGG